MGIEITEFEVLDKDAVFGDTVPFGKFKVRVGIKNRGRTVVDRAVVKITQEIPQEKVVRARTMDKINELADIDHFLEVEAGFVAIEKEWGEPKRVDLGEIIFKKVPPRKEMSKVGEFKEVGGYAGKFVVEGTVVKEEKEEY